MSTNDDRLRDFLQRATDDPPTDLVKRVAARVEMVEMAEKPSRASRDSASPILERSTAGRDEQRFRRRRIIIGALTVAAAVTLVVGLPRLRSSTKVSNSTVAARPQPGQLKTVFDLDLSAWPNASSTVGPNLSLEVRGGGRAETPDGPTGGVRFVPGGQQRSDVAFLTATGEQLRELFTPESGSVSIRLRPTADLVDRTTPTGRNISTYVQLVTEATNDPDRITATTSLGVSLHVDPEIGPYLAVTLNGGSTSIALPELRHREFDANRKVVIKIVWSKGNASVVLNEMNLHKFVYPLAPSTFTPSARLSVGASADYGAGYFAAHDDLLQRVTLQSSP